MQSHWNVTFGNSANGGDFASGLNDIEKCNIKSIMEYLGNFKTNYVSNIGMLPCKLNH